MALHAIQRFVLTGTPVENSLSDLWAQVNFLNPGLLGSFLFFRHHFLLPAETREMQKLPPNCWKWSGLLFSGAPRQRWPLTFPADGTDHRVFHDRGTALPL